MKTTQESRRIMREKIKTLIHNENMDISRLAEMLNILLDDIEELLKPKPGFEEID